MVVTDFNQNHLVMNGILDSPKNSAHAVAVGEFNRF
jgi:hypothetical protein